MGKGDKTRPRAARLTRKREAKDMGISPTPRRKARGKARMKEIDMSGNAAHQMLEARCRHAGESPTEDAMRDKRSPWWGCEAGRVMAAVTGSHSDRARLWDAIQHMRRVQVAYDRAIGAPKRHATCLRLLTPSGEMSADASSPPVDSRTDDERERQAVAELMALEGWLGYVDGPARSEAKRVVLDDAASRDPVALVAALRCISDGMAGKRMIWRGRA